MSLYATAVKKPVTTALVFVAIVIFGLFSLTRLSVDLLPEIETNTIMEYKRPIQDSGRQGIEPTCTHQWCRSGFHFRYADT